MSKKARQYTNIPSNENGNEERWNKEEEAKDKKQERDKSKCLSYVSTYFHCLLLHKLLYKNEQRIGVAFRRAEFNDHYYLSVRWKREVCSLYLCNKFICNSLTGQYSPLISPRWTFTYNRREMHDDL